MSDDDYDCFVIDRMLVFFLYRIGSMRHTFFLDVFSTYI